MLDLDQSAASFFSQTISLTQAITIFLFTVFADTDIKTFLATVRAELPQQNITPKLHLLEDHMVPFIRKWRAGPGLLGEQGGESVHKEFNVLAARHASMRQRGIDRLLAALREQHMQVHPSNVKKAPEQKKRK